jgi:anti-sigma regulatory factor (Ser/Thr protein kinase)
MPAHQRFEIGDASQVPSVRWGICMIAARLGFGEALLSHVATVVDECCENVLRHATSGELLVCPLTNSADAHLGGAVRFGIELLSIDTGGGVADVDARIAHGLFTAIPSDNGLEQARKLVDEFDIWSQPGLGTALRIVMWSDAPSGLWAARAQALPAGTVQFGAINLALRNQEVSGDTWTYTDGPHGFTVMIADGLGHGPLANTAAVAATRSLSEHGDAPLVDIVGVAHQALRPTVGAALGLARLPPHKDSSRSGDPGTDTSGRITSPLDDVARFCGIGNVAASVWMPSGHRHLASHPGIVGHTIRKTQEFNAPWGPDALLVLHSDGLATRWDLARYPGLSIRHPSVIAAVLYRDHSRAHDDITVFVARQH